MRKRSPIQRVFIALLVLAGLVLPTSIGPAHAQRAHASVTLAFWTPLSDPVARGALLPYLHKFEQSHPGISMKFVPVSTDNNWVKYTTAMAAGRGPDVALVFYNPPVPEWAANGMIQPLDPWLKQLHVSKDQWLPWVWKMQYFHGHVWTFLQEYDTNIFVWNKDAFKKAGLDPNKPPRTIAELDAYARKLTRFDNKGNLVQAGFIPWQWSAAFDDMRFWPAMFGGHMYDANRRTYTVDTQVDVRALTWIGTYAKMLHGAEKVNGFLGKFTGNNDPFFTGRVAMEMKGEWAPSVDWKLYAPKNLHYGVAAPPTGPGVPYGTNIVIGSDAFVMPAGTKHPKEAAELMLYMMGTAPVLTWCIDEANVPPTRAALFDPRFVKGVPSDASVVRTAHLAFKDPRILVPFPSSSIYDYATSQWITAEQQVEYGRKSPQAALSGLQKAIDQREAAVKQGNPAWYRNGD